MPAKKRRAAKARPLTAAAAERQTKRAAQKRRIVIDLTDEQMAALTAQYSKLNPAEAAELIFTLKKRPTSRIKVAGYSYHGDTCCA